MYPFLKVSIIVIGESEIIGKDYLPAIIDDNVEVIALKINGDYVMKDDLKIIGEKLINPGKCIQLKKYTNSALYVDLE